MRQLRTPHRIVVAAPLHADALARLSSLFSVELAQETTTLEALQSASGLMLSQGHAFSAARLSQSPRLQAIGLTGCGPGLVDLEAMTEAGIRVTHAPLDDTALIAGALWRSLERALNHHALDQKERGEVIDGPLRLRFSGDDALTDALAERSREAGFRVENPWLVQSATSDAGRVHFMVKVTDTACGQQSDQENLNRSATATTAQSSPALIDLCEERLALSQPGAIEALRDSLAVDGLIAAMGIGRDGFHPRFLLNPEVCPTSCC